ncbi:MAG TPA: hypothetical protein VJQ59_16935 [Candidatus Sulfotelmatobacter sp.]|nr:hypothetical protein [Candidatus Sulfotelmatobacter sp.]
MKTTWTQPEGQGQGDLWFSWKDYSGDPCSFLIGQIHGMINMGGKHMLILANGNSVQVPEAARDRYAEFIGWKKFND